MVRRLVRLVTAFALVATPALTVQPGAAARDGHELSAPSRFSPNGDGVEDRLRIRYTVPDRMRVRLEISDARTRRVHRRVDLGRTRGAHAWTWDGRSRSGQALPDGRYVLRLVADDGAGLPITLASDRVRLDTTFQPFLTTPAFGAAPGAAARVFPRTTVVADAVELTGQVIEHAVASLELVIRNGAGRVVRRADLDERLVNAAGGSYGRGRTVAWAARRGGKPLPRGRYTAVVTGRDLAGNAGRSEALRIWVSADRLEWRETATTVAADAHDFGPCAWSTANGCGDFPECGEVVPSAHHAGGLSHRSAQCPVPDDHRSTATSRHLLEVPEATGVRGLDAVRVSFAGAPTTPGEADTGTLAVWSDTHASTVVGTSGRSAWVEDPAWGAGLSGHDLLPDRAPAAAWSFVTRGTDAVDIATFTVELRYLAVAD